MIILIALITVILVTGIALIVILNNDSEPAPTAATTTGAVIADTTTAATTPWVPPFITDAPTTTVTPSTTPATTTQPTPSVTTTAPEVTTTPTPVTTDKTPEVSTPTTQPETEPVTTPPATTEEPPVTTKPNTPPAEPVTTTGIVEGEKVGSLGLYAAYTTVTNPADRTVSVKVTFYVQSYALRIGARNDNYLMINGEKLGRLSNEPINLPDKSPLTQTVLYEYETVLQTGDEPTTLELEFFWHIQATYSGVSMDWMSVKLELAF